MRANEGIDVYRDLYYEGGISSVYFWDLDDGFAGVVLLKKCMLTTMVLGLLRWTKLTHDSNTTASKD